MYPSLTPSTHKYKLGEVAAGLKERLLEHRLQKQRALKMVGSALSNAKTGVVLSTAPEVSALAASSRPTLSTIGTRAHISNEDIQELISSISSNSAANISQTYNATDAPYSQTPAAAYAVPQHTLQNFSEPKMASTSLAGPSQVPAAKPGSSTGDKSVATHCALIRTELPDSDKQRSQGSNTKRGESAPACQTNHLVLGHKLSDHSIRPDLACVLKHDRDLGEWLEMTGYFNLELRSRRLSRFRELAEMEAKKAKLDAERQKLLEEAAMDSPCLSLAYHPKVAKDGQSSMPAKRKYAESSGHVREPPEKMTRTEESRRNHEPSDYRRSCSLPQMHERYREYDSRKGGRDGRPRHRNESRGTAISHYSHIREPRDIDLGKKDDTRFFIIKSYNQENVGKCMEDGIWATQVQNEKLFGTAFAECKNVILFFSVNQSRAFQGFARMSTAPSSDIPRPKWMRGIHWEATPPFRVEWLSTTAVGFHRVGDIKNDLNDRLPVLVGRDGQEIDEKAGRDLFNEMANLCRRGYSGPRYRRTRSPL